MILTPEQVLKRTQSPDNIVKAIEELRQRQITVKIEGVNNPGGRPGAHNLTEEEKLAIGITAHYADKDTTAELFGISPTTATHLKNAQMTISEGRGTQRGGKNLDLQKKIQDRLASTKMTIEERAAEKLLTSMGLLTDEKMENCSAKELAQISNQMSQVVRNISTKDASSGSERGNGAKINIVLHSPREAHESSFEVLEIGLKN